MGSTNYGDFYINPEEANGLVESKKHVMTVPHWSLVISRRICTLNTVCSIGKLMWERLIMEYCIYIQGGRWLRRVVKSMQSWKGITGLDVYQFLYLYLEDVLNEIYIYEHKFKYLREFHAVIEHWYGSAYLETIVQLCRLLQSIN